MIAADPVQSASRGRARRLRSCVREVRAHHARGACS